MDSEASKFEGESSRQYSKVLKLDRRAQAELAQRLTEFSAFVRKLEVEAAERMAETGEKPIPGKVGMSAFSLPSRPIPGDKKK